MRTAIKAVAFSILINALILVVALLTAVAVGHSFWGCLAGCFVAWIVAVFGEGSLKSTFSWPWTIGGSVVIAVVNAGLAVFFSWTPWIVGVLPAVNVSITFVQALTSLPRRNSTPPVLASKEPR